MKRILPLALTFLLSSTAIPFAADVPHPSDTVTFKYIDATVAYERVRHAFPEISSVVTGIQVKKNTITLDLSAPRAEEVRTRLTAMDQRPKLIMLSAFVVETDEEHAHTTDRSAGKVLSRPTLFTKEGEPSVISERLSNGKYLKIIIQGRVIAGAVEK